MTWNTIKGWAQQLKGKVKQVSGELTGNADLVTSGKVDVAMGLAMAGVGIVTGTVAETVAPVDGDVKR